MIQMNDPGHRTNHLRLEDNVISNWEELEVGDMLLRSSKMSHAGASVYEVEGGYLQVF